MKAIEIVELIKQENPNTLGKMSDKKAAKVISAALRQISNQLAQASEGTVKIAALGAFAVKQVEREASGKKSTVKKIAFRAAKPKAGK